MTFRRYKLRLQTNLVELVHQPVCTPDQLFLVLVISRDAWKPQERIILLEIIVAHGGKLLKVLGSARFLRAHSGALAEISWAQRHVRWRLSREKVRDREDAGARDGSGT